MQDNQGNDTFNSLSDNGKTVKKAFITTMLQKYHCHRSFCYFTAQQFYCPVMKKHHPHKCIRKWQCTEYLGQKISSDLITDASTIQNIHKLEQGFLYKHLAIEVLGLN